MIDLFGNQVPENTLSKERTLIRKILGPHHYRPAEGEMKCSNCGHHRTHGAYKKRWYKCELLGFSSSRATDIKARYVCNAWTSEEP